MRVAFFATAAAVQVEVGAHEQSPLAALQSEFAAVEAEIKSAGRITPGVYATVQKLQVRS